MFGFGKKKTSKDDKRSARDDDRAVRGFFGSAKDESDARAARGEGWDKDLP